MRSNSPVTLVVAEDQHFVWMLGNGPISDLRLPPGGVDEPQTLQMLRCHAAELRAAGSSGSWMIVVDGEAVGLCGYKHARDVNGAVEVGYGIAASRRRLGYATRAVALLLQATAGDSRVSCVTAETAIDNVASRRVLELNGFARTGTRTDPQDGDLIQWRKALRHDAPT